MSQPCYHPSIEGAQHGAKSLAQFLDYAKKSGAAGAQPSNYMLQADKGFKTAKEIKDTFAKAKLNLDGVSSHTAFWVHTTAWTGSPTIRPFIPADVAKKSPAEIENWAEDYCLRLMDLCAELGVKIMPMFWGVAFGWELATGYPWGFWKGGDYDLLKEGQDRFVKKTAKLRTHARKLGLYLAHEIHPGTAAMCADDFNMLVEICGGDKCLAVNADPSHCWEGEDWETRFRKVGPRIYACHVKNFVIRPGLPLRMMEAELARPRDAIRGHPVGRSEHDALRRTAHQRGLPETLLRGDGHEDRAADRRSRKRLPRPRCDQRQWHRNTCATISASRSPPARLRTAWGLNPSR